MQSTSKPKLYPDWIQTIIACFAQSGSLGVKIVTNKYYTHKPLTCAWVPGCQTYLCIPHLNQSHSLTIRMAIIACFALNLGVKFVTDKYHTHKPLTCAWVPGRQTYLSIQHLNQSHFLTIRMDSNHNSMFCLGHLLIWLSEGQIGLCLE